MVIRAVLVAVIAAGAGCSYGGSFGDCEVACAASTGCPSGFTCAVSEGMCRSSATPATSCAAILDGGAGSGDGDINDSDAQPTMDAQSSTDAPSSMDAQTTVLLSQNANAIPTIGNLVYCAIGAGETKTNQWWRVFRLSDSEYGITGPTLHVTDVLFASQDAVLASVTVKLEAYTGTYDGPTLDTSKLTTLAMTSIPADGGGARNWTAPITIDIATTTVLAVEITSMDQHNAANGVVQEFHLGVNSAGETHKSYLGGSCQAPQSVSRDIILQVQGAF
ncbi:MAG TPA: hypothetical protein VGM90_34455 [Kofleriaceae bacterium]|jgi:hypothetical protein